jgi:hypothetical protein
LGKAIKRDIHCDHNFAIICTTKVLASLLFEIVAMSLTFVVTIPDPSSPKVVSNKPPANAALGDIKENYTNELTTPILPETLYLLSNLLTDLFNGILRKFSLSF